jgi:hypothetical protein
MAGKPMKIMKIAGPRPPQFNRSGPVARPGQSPRKVIADTSEALTLREPPIKPFSIFPVGMSIWPRSTHDLLGLRFLLRHSGRRGLWTCETPFEAMAQIKDYVAFYRDRVDEITDAIWEHER